MTYLCKIDSVVGKLYITSDGSNITGLWIQGQKYFESTIHDELKEADLPIFEKAKKWLDIYFKGKEPKFNLALKPEGSEFRKDVWKILLNIPYGKTITYGEIANILGKKYKKKMSAQAVGGAVGHNPISIIIPCHRVIGANGSLTGYAGGIDKKIKLLELEKGENQ